MTYTVYTPDTERGPTAYTQLQFTTIKELARWAMDAALAEPPAAPPQPPSELMNLLVHGVLPEESAPVRGVLETPAVAQEYDTDAWFVDVSGAPDRYVREIRERNWALLAKIFLSEIAHSLFRGYEKKNDYKKSCTWDDIKCFQQLILANPTIINEVILPESHVRWDLLPQPFLDAVSSELDVHMNSLLCIPRISLAEDYFKILKFFRDCKRHESWRKVSLDTGSFIESDPVGTTKRLVSAWWSGKKASDEMREFMLKAVVVQKFQRSKDASYIGGAEFLDSYNTVRLKVDELPAAFLDWATNGTTFKHCKKALGELGIPQARRAEGQRYTNIQLIGDGMAAATFEFNSNLEPYDGSGYAPFGSAQVDGINNLGGCVYQAFGAKEDTV